MKKLPDIKPATRFAYTIAGLKMEIEHYKADRETDPEFCDMLVSELEDAIETLKENE